MDKVRLESIINVWRDKILEVAESEEMINTYKMIKDIDQIIAEEFDREGIIQD